VKAASVAFCSQSFHPIRCDFVAAFLDENKSCWNLRSLVAAEATLFQMTGFQMDSEADRKILESRIRFRLEQTSEWRNQNQFDYSTNSMRVWKNAKNTLWQFQ